jgi:hypothetical protein
MTFENRRAEELVGFGESAHSVDRRSVCRQDAGGSAPMNLREFNDFDPPRAMGAPQLAAGAAGLAAC